MKNLLLSLLLACCALSAQPREPQTVLLWPAGAPGALGTTESDQPRLTIYLSARNESHTGVIVCPGGGYQSLAMDHEGKQIAQWLNGHGLAAFVLQYRLGPRYHHPAPLLDAQRALRTVRSHAGEWQIGTDRIGIWGFSAGGHLASTAATHFDSGNPGASDAVDRASSRPDFLILAYPVISLITGYTHAGSKLNLLGPNPDPKLVESLSNELQVTSKTPPVFLFHTDNDPVVPVENSVLFYSALKKAGVPAELHIYQNGPHGVGLAWWDPVLSSWPERLTQWLQGRGFMINKY